MINLVIEDYIASLKEKDELDILLPTLLKLKGYNIKNEPRTGERQYGVDLLAEKDGELYLYKGLKLEKKILIGENSEIFQYVIEKGNYSGEKYIVVIIISLAGMLFCNTDIRINKSEQ